MFGHDSWDRRDSGIRGLALAGGVAMIVALMLVAGVALIWIVAQGPAASAPPKAQALQTPTPRALSFAHTTTPTSEPAAPPTATAPALLAEADASGNAAAAATPDLLAKSIAANAPNPNAPILDARSAPDFAALATNSWSVAGDELVVAGTNATSEPWLTVARVPTANFAIEAEMRVTLVLDSVCDQSFGLVGGSPGSAQVYGGGVLFPCSGGGARVRLTDVSNWEDGYNGDAAVGEHAFDPGDGWHTYRFELRGNKMRLVVDGVGVVSGAPAAPFAAASDIEAGIWSQGVGLAVRRVSVYPLPTR